MFKCTKFYIERAAHGLFKQNKRYKGHSKWQNIRHIKGEMDAERSALFAQFAKRMKIAIIDGKSTKPSNNVQLAQVIEEAKKKSMPIGTINGVLEKIENSKSKAQLEVVDFRGPGNALFILRLMTDNIKASKIVLNTIFRKNACVVTDGKSLNVFHHQAFVLTEIERDLDTATDDAIAAGAEDVEIVDEDGECYRFVCDPQRLTGVTNHLKNMNYKIITSDEDFIPRSTVTLDENDLDKIDALCHKLNKIEEVISIYHNIEMPESEEETVKIDSKR